MPVTSFVNDWVSILVLGELGTNFTWLKSLTAMGANTEKALPATPRFRKKHLLPMQPMKVTGKNGRAIIHWNYSVLGLLRSIREQSGEDM